MGLKGYTLMKQWQCDDSSCPNNKHYCWKPFGETVHYKLYTEHIRLWNSAILSDEATVEKSPCDLKAKLYLMKQEEEKGRRKVGAKEKNHTSDITSCCHCCGNYLCNNKCEKNIY